MTVPQGPLFTKPRRRVMRLWAALALVNLCGGLFIALQPERLSDLATVARWTGDWLLRGQDVYASPDHFVDYPPHAIVLLSPLGALPFGLAVAFWVVANIAFAALSAYFAARFFQPHAPFRSIVLPILMFASWWGTHTLGQFSLLALMLSMAAMMAAERRPVVSGVYLGLSLIKPQVAVPVFLWTIFTRRWRTAFIALATVASGFAIYCARAGASPMGVIEGYVATLRMYYMGDAIMTGASDLRPLILLFVSDVSTVDTVAGGLAVALLAGICAAGSQEGRARVRTLYSAPPLVACWSLLSFYHLSYGYVVLLPVLMLLAFNDTPQTALRRGLLWVLQVGMMLNVPGLLRHSGVGGSAFAQALINHFDRFFMLAFLVGLVILAWRESASDKKWGQTP